MKKSSIHILIVTSVALCAGATLPFLFGHSTIDPEQQSVKSEVPYCVTSPSVPDKITFAGQEIDLTRYDHRERMDREQMSFTYMHSTTMLTIKRANRFFPIIEPILKENGVPDDFKYLAVIESNLNTLARSPAGAAGMWQFMQTTGREFGLEVNPNIDERYHVEKATRAACQYLKDAYQRYGNWLCVAAAYGWQGARNTARLTAWFVLLNLTLTGALFLPGAACNNLSFYLPVSPGLLLASTAGVCGVVEGVLHVLGRSGPACFGAELSVAGQVVPLSVFCDTGFHLQEPLSGRAVVLVRLDAVSLPAELRAYLGACLAGVGAEPRPEWGVRFVPCQTVAGHCLLPALPAALASNGKKQDGIYAAFCDMTPPPGGWTALVSAETAALLGK